MTITFTPSIADLGEHPTGQLVHFTISASSDLDPAANVSLLVTQDIETPGVEIANTSPSSVDIIGTYDLSMFPGYRTKYVRNGTSESFTVRGFPGLSRCSDNELYDMRPDPRESRVVTYNAYAIANNGVTVEADEQHYTVSVLQSYSSMKAYITKCLGLSETAIAANQEIISLSESELFTTGANTTGQPLGEES